MLLKAGSKVDLRDQLDHTPLYYASKKEYRNIIELLIEHRARLEHVRMPFVVIPSWVYGFVAHREECRSTSYAILQLARRRSSVIGGNRRDVLGIIARMTWESRHARSWDPKIKMKRVNFF
jgi:ankyrin repeat protein